MAGFGFDAGAIAAEGKKGNMYSVVQVVLTEKFIGTGSGVSSLTNLQRTINEQAAKGYRLHTISTTSSGSKGFLRRNVSENTISLDNSNGVSVSLRLMGSPLFSFLKKYLTAK